MLVKKSGKTIFGAELNAAEKKALDMEIRRSFAEFDRMNRLEIASLILWQLHTQLGFGPDRLKKFHDNFNPELDKLIERYELEDTDSPWLCMQLLKEYGIDIQEWDRSCK